MINLLVDYQDKHDDLNQAEWALAQSAIDSLDLLLEEDIDD